MKDKKQSAAKIIMTVLSVAAVCFIFGNSIMNADDSSGESGWMTDFVNGILRLFGFELSELIIRKLAHFTEFAVLGALLCTTVYLYTHKRSVSVAIALPSCLAVAVCDELIQLGSDGRSCELRDMLIDFSGAATAVLIVFIVLTVIERRKQEGEENG